MIGYTNGTSKAVYAYDVLERRIAKTVYGKTEAYIHDRGRLSDVVLDFTAGALTKRWLHGPRIDEPLAYESYAASKSPGSGSVKELFRNRLGSILVAATMSTGAVAAEYSYDSFGARTTTGTAVQRYGFTGREHDDESGLIYFRARYYDPVAGQFIQRDPIGFAAGDLNLYAYVWNDPHNLTDPSGLVVASDAAGLHGSKRGAAAGSVGVIGHGVMSLVNRLSRKLLSGALAMGCLTSGALGQIC